MAERVNVCKISRSVIKSKLTNFEKVLDSITAETDIESLDLGTRLKKKHIPLQKEFDKCQDEIDKLTFGNEEEEAINEKERSDFENRFYLISGSAALQLMRYHNKKFIIDSHVKALFELPPMSKEFSIRVLYDLIQKHLRSLRALSVEVDKWDAMLNHLIKGKINNYTMEKWEESICDIEKPTLLHMLNFLERRSQIEETRAATNQVNFQKASHSRQNPHHPFMGVATATTPSADDAQSRPFSKISCYICKGEHGVYSCSKFLSLSPNERHEAARKVSLCVNCLRGNHHPKNCLSGWCRKCGKRHNSLFHFNEHGSDSINQVNNSSQQSQSTQSIQESPTPVRNYKLLIPSEVVLATAIVDIIDKQGKLHACRVMLDCGSQPYVVTENFANKIGLNKIAVDIPLEAVDNLATSIKHTATATIQSRYNNVRPHLSLFVVKDIGNTMPTLPVDRSSFEIPQDLFLADPGFHNPTEVDMILGAQYFYHFLRQGQILITNHPAVFQETELGWVVAGCFHQVLAKHAKVYCNFTKFSDLSLLWEFDASRTASMRSVEEEACESNYVKNTERDELGRYTIHLPFNENKIKIGESRQTAFNRFHSLERKFEKDPRVRSQYFECIQIYLNENHMTPLKNEESSDRGFFLPHHAVIKTSSLTTKTRVVFDGSCKSSSGISLNDALMVGPTIQDDLFSTFTRFRTFLVALTADIEQMYRQIQLTNELRLFHKILWRETPTDPIKVNTLNTVTFGTASAPFLAIRTLHQLAEDERENIRPHQLF
ncbi:uncharacterized protein LOC117170833 [Belonocnema kinseyi]|uniref:uncharacterized protein LOC117170833 n=1 Tax=Belonocnema kinseyi TaxID=2817044 RepID=UPI00143D9A36|nr:uncharacterized protein LOC117170833 [Belonocnema kinseyi]